MSTSAITPSTQIGPTRLWFGFSAAAFTWCLAGFLDTTFAWYACFGSEMGWGVFTATGMRVLLGFISFALLAVTVAAGVISYGNWRRLSESESFIEAEARGRQQFMAFCGVYLSASLGVGIVLFSMTVYFLNICERVR